MIFFRMKIKHIPSYIIEGMREWLQNTANNHPYIFQAREILSSSSHKRQRIK